SPSPKSCSGPRITEAQIFAQGCREAPVHGVRMAISSVSSVAASAVTGIRAASRRMDNAAATLSSAVSPPPAGDTVTISAASRQAAAGGGESGAVAGAMIDLRVAKYQSAAQVAVLHTADDMTSDLLSLGSSKGG